jgi:hypothetical protein
MRAQTIDIDETVTLADETIANLQHVPETYAETDLLEYLHVSISISCYPWVRDGFCSAYAIWIFLVDVVFEALVVAFPEILGTDLDQVGHGGLWLEFSLRIVQNWRI